MTEELDWADIVDSANMRAVWKGHLEISKEPRMTMWWQAWHNVSGGRDVMHVGVTCIAGTDAYGEGFALAQRMLTGVLNMAWRAVGGELGIETVPLSIRRFGKLDGWTGKVIVRANTGKQFDPLMKAIQETKISVEET